MKNNLKFVAWFIIYAIFFRVIEYNTEYYYALVAMLCIIAAVITMVYFNND